MAEPREPFGRPESRPPEPRVNILLVDDQPANLLALKAILEDLGHNLVAARSGEEALRRLGGGEFAVVLLDVRMPGLDGLETAKLIRGREITRRTPIIFVTAFESDRLLVEQAYALGAVDYLVKPLVPVIVRAKVAGLVELFERTQEVRRQAERIRTIDRRGFEQALAQENARLRESEERLAAELAATRRLHELTTRLLTARDLRTALDEVLDAAVTMHGADMGNVQLYDPQAQALEIAAQQGFRPEFLASFRTVSAADDSACGRATRGGSRVVIEDVQADPAYAPYRQLAAAAGYRAVQSTPLLGRRGELLGVLSTHFRRPHRPSERDLRLLDLYARQAADLIDRLRAEEALREADRRKDEFLAMLAHELRNPLAPIRNAVQLLRWKGPPDPDLQNAGGIIERQVRQMSRLVDDLLDVSRIGRGKLTLRREPTSLGVALAHAVESSRPLIEAAGHDLAVALPPETILLEADPTRLAQVFLNLLNNAAKYTPQGGRIELTAQMQGGEVVVRVRDTGIGIPAPMLSRVFELFTQVDRSLERSQGGLGVGLTLVRRLVEMHGGNVEARSEGPGQGSEFVVRLPVLVTPAAPSLQPASGGERVAAAVGLRILLVDDNRDAAESLGLLLQVQGHEVRAAHDGAAGLEAAASFRPDVALLDIGMPKLNGYDLARRLRRQAWGRDMVLIALTGWGKEDDRRRTREAGFDHHLVKPVDLDVLQALFARTAPVGLGAS